MSRARVLLADDHTIVAEGLRSLLENSYDFVGVVADGRALLEAAMRLKPDVIVADISMPLLNGLDAVRQLKKDGSSAKVVILTMHSDTSLAAEAFRAGASGFILKHSAGEELSAAIEQVLSGGSYLTPLIAKDLISMLADAEGQSLSSAGKLTPRQREVLQLIAEGRTMKEIASLLCISTRTAESHKYEMMDVLGTSNTAGLVQYAIKIGLVSV
jgi:DNA-binding NarL/FixJ family response regulator